MGHSSGGHPWLAGPGRGTFRPVRQACRLPASRASPGAPVSGPFYLAREAGGPRSQGFFPCAQGWPGCTQGDLACARGFLPCERKVPRLARRARNVAHEPFSPRARAEKPQSRSSPACVHGFKSCAQGSKACVGGSEGHAPGSETCALGLAGRGRGREAGVWRPNRRSGRRQTGAAQGSWGRGAKAPATNPGPGRQVAARPGAGW